MLCGSQRACWAPRIRAQRMAKVSPSCNESSKCPREFPPPLDSRRTEAKTVRLSVCGRRSVFISPPGHRLTVRFSGSGALPESVNSLGNNQLVWVGVPPSPRSFGIIGLGGKSRQVFGFKGLIGKVSRNKDLACQRALKMGLGQLRGPFGKRTNLSVAPIRSLLSHRAGWKSVMAVTAWL